MSPEVFFFATPAEPRQRFGRRRRKAPHVRADPSRAYGYRVPVGARALPELLG